jgi:hypothetical protein
MGEYAVAMGYSSAVEFGVRMSISEVEQLHAFVLYCQKIAPAITAHMKKKDFSEIAREYNGPSYAENSYDMKIEAAYKEFSK